MPIYVEFRCGGCDARVTSEAPIRKEFVSFSGRGHGFGSARFTRTVEDVTPAGWVAFDPYTYATYCPACWAEIEQPNNEVE